MARSLILATLIAAACAFPALADTVRIAVKTQDGTPATEAVVELVPPAGATLPPSDVAEKAEIDQRNLTFIPFVTLIRRGGRVIFSNSDTTMHQVYSFAAIKQFQFEIHQGERSPPVVFDQTGIAAVGCNIHDQMIAYVYVAASPFAAMTDASGTVRFDNVPAGTYQVTIWHPRLPPGEKVPPRPLVVGTSLATASYSLPSLLAPAKSHMHMGAY